MTLGQDGILRAGRHLQGGTHDPGTPQLLWKTDTDMDQGYAAGNGTTSLCESCLMEHHLIPPPIKRSRRIPDMLQASLELCRAPVQTQPDSTGRTTLEAPRSLKAVIKTSLNINGAFLAASSEPPLYLAQQNVFIHWLIAPIGPASCWKRLAPALESPARRV